MTTRKRISLIALIGITIVILGVLAPRFAATHRETQGLEQSYTAFAESLKDQHYEDAYMQCGADFRSAMPYSQFLALFQELRDRYGALQKVTRVAYEVRGTGTPMAWRAVVDADLVYEKSSLRFEFVFHKEDGRWVIFGAEQL